MEAILAPVDRLANTPIGGVREVDVVTTAFRSFKAKEITYVSTPITSGGKLYEAVKKSGKPLKEFTADKGRMYAEVIAPNIALAETVGDGLIENGFSTTVISPATFEAKQLGWTQDQYMALWLRVINEKVTRVAMVDGWEYSNGGIEELVEAFLMASGHRSRTNIDVVDERGAPITAAEAFERITEAMYDLNNTYHATPRVHAEATIRLNTYTKAGRPLLHGASKKSLNEAGAFVREFPELLSQLDPAYIDQSSIMDSKLWALRQEEPMDAHLMRPRESFGDNVTLKVKNAS